MTVTDDAPEKVINLEDGESSTESFAMVRFGGYDRRQVDDYLDRVEASFNDYDVRLAESSGRVEELQRELEAALERLTQAEKQAAGEPEPASRLTGRLAAMLQLAEEEAAELRANVASEADAGRKTARTEAEQLVRGARAEAESIVSAAKERADRESAERSAELTRREREAARATEAAEAATVQAQRDAEAVRAQAKRDADNTLTTARRESEALRATTKRDTDNGLTQARQDVQLLHEQARKSASEITADAEKQVRALQRQKDAIAAQLQQLRDAVSAAVGPLAGETGPPTPSARQGTSVRRDPSTPGS